MHKGSEKLKGKTAIITGGDSGIGRSVAILYAREGANVTIVYIHNDKDAEDTKKLVEKEGGKCLPYKGDVGKKDVCEQIVRKTLDTFGSLDILVNHAGLQFKEEKFVDIKEENLRRVCTSLALCDCGCECVRVLCASSLLPPHRHLKRMCTHSFSCAKPRSRT